MISIYRSLVKRSVPLTTQSISSYSSQVYLLSTQRMRSLGLISFLFSLISLLQVMSCVELDRSFHQSSGGVLYCIFVYSLFFTPSVFSPSALFGHIGYVEIHNF